MNGKGVGLSPPGATGAGEGDGLGTSAQLPTYIVLQARVLQSPLAHVAAAGVDDGIGAAGVPPRGPRGNGGPVASSSSPGGMVGALGGVGAACPHGVLPAILCSPWSDQGSVSVPCKERRRVRSGRGGLYGRAAPVPALSIAWLVGRLADGWADASPLSVPLPWAVRPLDWPCSLPPGLLGVRRSFAGGTALRSAFWCAGFVAQPSPRPVPWGFLFASSASSFSFFSSPFPSLLLGSFFRLLPVCSPKKSQRDSRWGVVGYDLRAGGGGM